MFWPNKSKILDKLVKQASILKETAKTFQELTHHWDKLNDYCSRLGVLEHQADELVHIITDDVETVFITPLDKSDIKELTEMLDDVIDNLEQAANHLNIYKIRKSNEALKDFSRLILQAVEQIYQGILVINEHKLASRELVSCYKKIHDIEKQGDELDRRVLKSLIGDGSPDFNGKDTLSVIKWKEIFQTLEDTLDRCEDIAILFEKLRMNYK